MQFNVLKTLDSFSQIQGTIIAAAAATFLFLTGYSFIFLVSDKNYLNFEENGNIMVMTRGALPLIKLIIN